jgi:hypothetical protein
VYTFFAEFGPEHQRMASHKIETTATEISSDLAGRDYAAAAAGGFSMLVALTVLAGWHTGAVFLVRLSPASAPMLYNTAAGLLIAGCGLTATAYGKRLPAILFGGGAGLIGVLGFVQATIRADLGIDQLLHRDLISSSAFPPGRMAASTALCLAVTAGAILLMNAKRRPAWHPWLLGAMGTIVASAGFAALLCYAGGVTAPHDWATFAPMAQHTAAAFPALGAASAWRRCCQPQPY